MQLNVRPAVLADIPAIAGIYAHWVTSGTASFELTPPDAVEMRRRFETAIAGGYPYLVAQSATADVAGYAYASAYRHRPAYRWTVEDSIYIAHDAQRSGAGRRLLGALIDECTKRGYRQLIAVIGDSAQTPSIALHRSLGFEQTAILRAIGYKFGKWLDVVLMQRALGASDTTPPAIPVP